MKQQEGYIVPGKEHLVCLLKRSICTYMVSSRHLDAGTMHFTSDSRDPCLYVSSDSEGDMLIIAVYVDNMILGGKSEERMNEVKDNLSKRFKMKDLGLLHQFLGVTIIQDRSSGNIWIGQPLYTEQLLEKFEMSDCMQTSQISCQS